LGDKGNRRLSVEENVFRYILALCDISFNKKRNPKEDEMKIRQYSIKHDVYDWWWNGERWTISKFAVAVYTKSVIPGEIRGMPLKKVDEVDVTTWIYEGGGRRATIVKI
jgi:hypothetical protein